MEVTLRREAEQYLGTTITPPEWDKAKPYAERKLGLIINREGDADGERQEPWYLAQLIAEAVRANRLTVLLHSLDELRLGTKKERLASKDVNHPLTSTPIVAQENKECNRRI